MNTYSVALFLLKSVDVGIKNLFYLSLALSHNKLERSSLASTLRQV